MIINEIKRENQNIHLEVVLCSRDFDRFYAYCEDCGEIVLKEKAVEIDGDYYCNSCLVTCDTCGCLHPRRYSHTVEDSDYNYCGRCFEDETYLCNDCGRRFRYSDSVTEIDGYFYCDECVDEHKSPIECYHTFKSSGGIKFYDDGRTEEYEVGFHNLYPLYLTKEGDIYGDFADSAIWDKISMENLTYLGHGYIVSNKSPIGIVEFRKDVVGFI